MVDDEIAASPAVTRANGRGVLSRHKWLLLRLAGFTAITFVLAFGDPRKIARAIPGNPGDAYLILATLEWGGQRAGHLFRGYWDGPFFATGDTVMAYTDTLLPLTVPFGILEGVTGSRVVAFNVLYLASWIVCAEATYRLALRLIGSRAAAIVCGIAFTFSTIRLEQASHFQLAWSGFVPLSVLLLLRLRERPTIARGLALSAAVLTQVLTSAYHGVIVIVFVSGVLAIDFVVAAYRRSWRKALPGYAAFFVALVGVMLPVQYMYRQAEHSHQPRSGYPAHAELHLGDLRTPAPSADLPRLISFFDRGPDGRSENFAYLGLLVMVLVPVAVGILATRRERLGLSRARVVEWALVLLLGAVGFVLAVGRRPVFGFQMPFYDIGRVVIPGFESIVAIVRLVVFTQLALVLVAGWALAWLFRRRRPLERVAVALALSTFVVLEAHQDHPFIDVVSPQPGSVYGMMQQLDPGVAVELPMAGRETGAAYAFIESTRAVLGTDDDVQLVNGYSGHTPNDYDDLITLFNSFPAPDAVSSMRERGVDYIVIHTAPITTGEPSLDTALDGTGYTFIDPVEAERRLAQLPAGEVEMRLDATDGVVLVLTD